MAPAWKTVIGRCAVKDWYLELRQQRPALVPMVAAAGARADNLEELPGCTLMRRIAALS